MPLNKVQISARLTRFANAHIEDVMRVFRYSRSEAIRAVIRDVHASGRDKSILNSDPMVPQQFVIAVSALLTTREDRILRDAMGRIAATEPDVTKSRALNRVIEEHTRLGPEESAIGYTQDPTSVLNSYTIPLPSRLAEFLEERAQLLGVDSRVVIVDALAKFARRHKCKGVIGARATDMERRGLTVAAAQLDVLYDKVKAPARTRTLLVSRPTLYVLQELSRDGGGSLAKSVIMLFDTLKQDQKWLYYRPEMCVYSRNVLIDRVAFTIRGADLKRLDDLALMLGVPSDQEARYARGFALGAFVMAYNEMKRQGMPTAHRPKRDNTPKLDKPYLNEVLLFSPTHETKPDSVIGIFGIADFQESIAYRDAPPSMRKALLATTAAMWHDCATKWAYREASAALRAQDMAAVSRALTAAAQHQSRAAEAHENGERCKPDAPCRRCAYLAEAPLRDPPQTTTNPSHEAQEGP